MILWDASEPEDLRFRRWRTVDNRDQTEAIEALEATIEILRRQIKELERELADALNQIEELRR